MAAPSQGPPPLPSGAALDQLVAEAADEGLGLQFLGCCTRLEIGGPLRVELFASLFDPAANPTIPVRQPRLFEAEPTTRAVQRSAERWTSRQAARLGLPTSVREEAWCRGNPPPPYDTSLAERLERVVAALPHLRLRTVDARCQPPRTADRREPDHEAIAWACARFEGRDGREVSVQLLFASWPERCPPEVVGQVAAFRRATTRRR